MQSISSSSSCFRIPIPNRVSLNSHRRLKYRPTTLSLSASVSTFSIHLTTRSSSGKEDETQKNDHHHHHSLLHLGCGGSDEVKTPELQFQEPEQQQSSPKRRGRKSTGRGISASMWWVDLRAAFGQRFNWEGIVCFSSVLARDQHLVLPHVAVRDVRRIDWAELQRRGFKGVVFDKDNTITAPYCLTLWGPIAPSIEQCKSVFGQNIAIFSNSAGLHEYDHNGAKAKALEWSIGIKVIRHRVKKPAGAAEEIERHFGCDSSQLIMVGDRPFTDIVYGNRNGFLTVLVEPLSRTEEPFIVRQVRKLENAIVKRWSGKGLKPISHRLLPNPAECVNNSSPTT